MVCHESLRQTVMTAGDSMNTLRVVMASRTLILMSGNHTSNDATHPGSRKVSKPRSSTEGQRCSHCGKEKHTMDTCFQLHGFPKWWQEFQARKQKGGCGGQGCAMGVSVGVAAMMQSATGMRGNLDKMAAEVEGNLGRVDLEEPQLSLIPTREPTYEPTISDFSETTVPRRAQIANANGEISQVTGAGSVNLSSFMKLSNTLLVPSLSHKLLSEIIGRGTKRGDCITWRISVLAVHVTHIDRMRLRIDAGLTEVRHCLEVLLPELLILTCGSFQVLPIQRYLAIVKEEGLQISQPAIDADKSAVHHRITKRENHSKVHRRTINLKRAREVLRKQFWTSMHWMGGDDGSSFLTSILALCVVYDSGGSYLDFSSHPRSVVTWMIDRQLAWI